MGKQKPDFLLALLSGSSPLRDKPAGGGGCRLKGYQSMCTGGGLAEEMEKGPADVQ